MRTISVLLIAVSLGIPASASAAQDPLATCQHAIDKAGVLLLQATLKAGQGCAARVAKGNLPPQTRCWGPGDATAAISDAKTRDAIDAARARAVSAMDKACGQIDLQAPPPAGLDFPTQCAPVDLACNTPLFDRASVLTCLACTHVASAQHLLTVQHPIGTGRLATVDLHFTASASLSAFQVAVHYDVAEGSFAGTADGVQCTSSAGPDAIFGKNDQDAAGSLILIEAADQLDATSLSFPLDIDCLFEARAGTDVTAGDFTVDVTDVTIGGTSGDLSLLGVTVSIL